MDIEIIRREKSILQQKISELITEFEKRTSVDVDVITMEKTYNQMVGSKPQLIKQNISIFLKI